MRFKSFFAESKIEVPSIIDVKEISEDASSSIEKIRSANIKIKNIHPTKFGTEVLFFKITDAEKAASLVNGQIDGKSIFIK